MNSVGDFRNLTEDSFEVWDGEAWVLVESSERLAYKQALADAVGAISRAYDDPAPMRDGMTKGEEIAEMYGRNTMFEDALAAIDALRGTE